MQFVSASSFDASGTHTTTLNGATAQTLAMSAPLTSRFQNVTFANPAGTTLQSNFTALGNVHLLNGSVSGATVQVTIAGTLMDSFGGFQPAQGITFNGGPTPVSALTSTINVPVSFNANPSILQANLMVNGAVIVQGNLQLNSHYLVVNGTFTTLANGQLTMTNAGDSAYVSGNATFGGGSEAGILTNGKLKLNGNFSQANNGGGQGVPGRRAPPDRSRGLEFTDHQLCESRYRAGRQLHVFVLRQPHDRQDGRQRHVSRRRITTATGC